MQVGRERTYMSSDPVPEPKHMMKHIERVNTKAMYRTLSKLSREYPYWHLDTLFNMPHVPFVNLDLARFYKNNIEKYAHVVHVWFAAESVMILLDIIHKYMQLHERMLNKQKTGWRIEAITKQLDETIETFKTVSSSFVVRHWRHPKISTLVDIKMQADKLFNHNFIIREYS